MQGISDESFIKTQGKGKQLNKLIPQLPRQVQSMHGPNIRQIEAVMQPLYPLVSWNVFPIFVLCISLDHKPFLLNQTYMAVYCLMNAYSFTVSSTN